MPSGLLRPEEQLLFRLAAPRHSAEAIRSIVARGVNWERVAALLYEEGVVGGVWRTLRTLDVPVPPAVAAQLQGVAALSDFRLMEVRRLLERTVARLEARGIEVMLAKGAALGAFIYSEPCDRNMADIDLVLPADRAREAAALLSGGDWSNDMAALKEVLYEEHHHLPPMSDTIGLDIRLEIHTDVLPKGHPLHYGVEALRARAERRPFGGATVLIPSVEDLLVYSCVHLGWSHEMRVGGWRAFRDVAELTDTPGFSWDRFLDLARDPTLASSCYWTLELAARLCGAAVPAHVLAGLRPRLPAWVAEVVARHLTLQLVPLSSRNPSEALSRWLWTIAMRPGLAGHGAVRPWHHAERKILKSRELGIRGAGRDEPRWWANAVGIRETVAYLRRLTT